MNTHIHTQHILTKVLDYKGGEWDTHIGPNSSKQFSMQLCKGSGPYVGSKVGMHCTYSNCLVSGLHMIATRYNIECVW